MAYLASVYPGIPCQKNLVSLLFWQPKISVYPTISFFLKKNKFFRNTLILNLGIACQTNIQVSLGPFSQMYLDVPYVCTSDLVTNSCHKEYRLLFSCWETSRPQLAPSRPLAPCTTFPEPARQFVFCLLTFVFCLLSLSFSFVFVFISCETSHPLSPLPATSTPHPLLRTSPLPI